MESFIRMKELVDIVGLRSSAIYAMRRAGDFPCQVLIGERAVAWRQIDIEAWMAARPVKGCTRVHNSRS